MCYTKLSGLGTFIRKNDPQHIAEITGETVELFGAERCMWGSNFPIEKIWTDYRSIVDAIRAAVAGYDAKAQSAILHDTAARDLQAVSTSVFASSQPPPAASLDPEIRDRAMKLTGSPGHPLAALRVIPGRRVFSRASRTPARTSPA
jgi:hypothetical protein